MKNLNVRKKIVLICGVLCIIGVLIWFKINCSKNTIGVMGGGQHNFKYHLAEGLSATGAGIGDRLNCLSDFLYYGVAFNKQNFINNSSEHPNSGLEELFSNLPQQMVKTGKEIKHVILDVEHLWGDFISRADRKIGFFETENIFFYDWGKAQKVADKMYRLLDLDRKKKELVKKYGIPENYFKNSCSLHFRIGDRKNTFLKEVNEYIEDIRNILNKTKLEKIICFYENDAYSKETAEQMISEIKKFFPGLKFEKSVAVEKDYEELLLMSMCENNMRSNSFFSKWAILFNQNKKKVVVGKCNYDMYYENFENDKGDYE